MSDTILTVIKGALPVNPAGEQDAFANRRLGAFGIQDLILMLWPPLRDQSGKSKGDEQAAPLQFEKIIPLFLNGAALIDHEIISDDGLVEVHHFVMIGKTRSGRPLAPLTVPVAQFASMNWTLQWGNQLVPAPGNGNKDNARAAIQMLSGEVKTLHEYRHTGWRKFNGEWHYLSGSGAISAGGMNEQIRVELDQNMRRYCLPAPPDNPRDTAGFVLDLLHIAPNNPAVGAALVYAICRAPLAEAAAIDFSIFLAGRTNAGKSECAALALAFFGEFSARTFPANFSDSESVLGKKSFQAKDAVFVVDDYCPSTNNIEASKLHNKAEILFRGVGNQSGRGRSNYDISGQPVYYPRCMMISTGEDVPRGSSLLARMLVVEMQRGDIPDLLPSGTTAALSEPATRLSGLQGLAASGRLAQAMAAYVRWLAPRMDDLKSSFPAKIVSLRDEAKAEGFAPSHSRAADIYASMRAGFELFLDFLLDVGAKGETSANELSNSTAETLKAAIMAQGEYKAQSDEIEVFKNLLQSCFVSGDCHVCNNLNQGPPVGNPHTWGWRAMMEGGDLAGRGAAIGWINEVEKKLWLEPEATFKVIKRLAEAQGEPFLITKATLWKRLLERKVLLLSEPDKKTGKARPTVQRTINNRAVRVLVFSTRIVTGVGELE